MSAYYNVIFKERVMAKGSWGVETRYIQRGYSFNSEIKLLYYLKLYLVEKKLSNFIEELNSKIEIYEIYYYDKLSRVNYSDNFIDVINKECDTISQELHMKKKLAHLTKVYT